MLLVLGPDVAVLNGEDDVAIRVVLEQRLFRSSNGFSKTQSRRFRIRRRGQLSYWLVTRTLVGS
jgi:hypothetical protein